MLADPIALSGRSDASQDAEALLVSCLTWRTEALWSTLGVLEQQRVLLAQECAEHALRLAGLARRVEALTLSAELARELSR